MEDKNSLNLSAYERLLADKEEANMHYIAECIHEMDYEINDFIDIPSDIEDDMVAFCKSKDKENERKKNEKNIYVFLRRCAVLLLCFGIVGGVSIISVDAWRAEFTKLIMQQGKGYVTLSPTDIGELENWNNYYFLEQLPYGYELSYCASTPDNKQIYFSNGTGTIALFQYDASTKFFIDSETANNESVSVRNKDALYSEDDENLTKEIIWLDGLYSIVLYCEGDESIKKDDLILLAEKITFIK